jgi:hypothetical protein
VPTRRSDSAKEMVRAVIGLAAFEETHSVSRYHRIHVTKLHLYGLSHEIPKKSRKARSLVVFVLVLGLMRSRPRP